MTRFGKLMACCAVAVAAAGVTPLRADAQYHHDFHGRDYRHFTPEELQVRLKTDSHAPANFRAIGAPSNLTSFAHAFECKPGAPMVRTPCFVSSTTSHFRKSSPKQQSLMK